MIDKYIVHSMIIDKYIVLITILKQHSIRIIFSGMRLVHFVHMIRVVNIKYDI